MSVIRAAGAVLWRKAGCGSVEVAVIHRPRYLDWTLPKGKGKRGEKPEETAAREVEEETGFRGRIGASLGESRYEVADGEKVVEYWEMEAGHGRFRASDEVDEMQWLRVEDAAKLLSYERDREVLRRFVATRS